MELNKNIMVSPLRIIKSEESKNKINNENQIQVEYQNGMYIIKNNQELFLKYQKAQEKYVPIEILTPIDKVLTHLKYRTQKEILNPIESALIFKEILEITGVNQRELAQKLNKTQGNISNKIRLLSLPLYIQIPIINNTLTERHGRALLQLVGKEDAEEKMKLVHREIVQKQLNVQETEIVINKVLGKVSKNKNEEIEEVNDKRELRNKTAVLAINQISQDLTKSMELINKYYPELVVDIKEGIKNKDFEIKISIKNVN